MRRDAHEQNRQSWNAAVPAHNRHKGDQAAFFRDGGSTLYPTERAILGDLRGKRLVHLQCNCGQDTLSLAQFAGEVTGVDISDAAVEFARSLAEGAGIQATFHRADVLDWLAQTDERFDVAFASYGALSWLSDIAGYFRGVARVLRPGGRYIVVEFHPACFMFDVDWVRRYPYSSHGKPIVEAAGVGDYVGASLGALVPPRPEPPGAPSPPLGAFVNPHASVDFLWGLGEILGGMLAAGLQIEHFAEYDYSEGWRGFDDMQELPGRRWTVPEGMQTLPFMFSVVALAPG